MGCGTWNLEVVKYLVEQGALMRMLIMKKLYAFAALNGFLEVVKYLVELGADVYANDEQALRWAMEGGNLEVVKYLVKQEIEE